MSPSFRHLGEQLIKTFVGTFMSFENNFSTKIKSVTVRDLKKISNRVKYLTSKDCTDLYLHFNDCTQGHLPREKITHGLASLFGFTQDEAKNMLAFRQPKITIDDEFISIGRAKIRKFQNHQYRLKFKDESIFAATHLASSLLEKIATCVQFKEPVLLVGETGTGKTSCVQRLANLCNKKLHVLNLNQQSESTDLLGGYKPVEISSLLKPIVDTFESCFFETFDSDSNKKFLTHLQSAMKQSKWIQIVKLLNHPTKIALEKFQDASDEQERFLYNRWKSLSLDLNRVHHSIEASQDDNVPLLFSFIEGVLVKAIKNGDWILLDEINLAPPELLDCLSGLLDNQTGSIILTQRGDKESLPRNPEFHLFGAMNPSTDVGKRDLPLSLRNRFTEFYSDELNPEKFPEDFEDLQLIIKSYLNNLNPKPQDLANIIDLFVEACKLSKTCLVDGIGNRPHFNLRTLCRSLVDSNRAYHGSVIRSLYEGFMFSFGSQINRETRPLLQSLAVKKLLGQKDPALLTCPLRMPQTPKDDYVKIEGYWLSKGPRYQGESAGSNSSQNQADKIKYIITPAVSENLRDLVRVVGAGGSLPILLQGETSVGKTSLITYLGTLVGQVIFRINNHEHTDIQCYLGSYSTDEMGKLKFFEGPLVQAMRKGYWLILDELNLAPTEILEALNRVLDDNRELYLPETGELIKAHPKFRLFATQNPPGLYGGRKVLSRALRNRFIELHLDPLPREDLEMILHKKCDLPISRAKKMSEAMHLLQIHRRTSSVFQGNEGFVTLRDLFRWAERYHLAFQDELTNGISNLFDWDLYLAHQGYLVISGRVRKDDECLVVKAIIEKIFKRTIIVDELFELNEKTSPVARDCLTFLRDLDTSQYHELTNIVWTREMRRLAVLLWNCFKFHEPVLLVGETGCGKTTVCQAFARILKQELIAINFHMNTEAADFLGSLKPVHGQSDDKKLFEWVDGPLLNAMNNGSLLLIDEISLADDAVIERLNSVLEPERKLLLAERGSESSEELEITAKREFLLVATMNPGGDFGKKELSPALRNRFTEIWCPTVSFENMKNQETLLKFLNDWQEICKHRLKLAQFEEEVAEKISRAIVSFATWFSLFSQEDEFASKFRKMPTTIRDLIAWIDFISTMKKKQNVLKKTIRIEEVFLHGACLVFLDALSSQKNEDADEEQSSDSLEICLNQAIKCLILNSLTAESDHEIILSKFRPIYFDNSVNCFKDDPIKLLPSTLDPKRFLFGHDVFFVETGDFFGKLGTQIEKFSIHSPMSSKNLFKLLRGLQLTNRAVLLEGSPGVGKTSLVMALARATGNKITRINLSESTEVSDLFGCYLPSEGSAEGKFEWRDGPMLKALKDGDWILLDEMNLAPQAILEALNSCLDHRGSIFIAELNQEFIVNNCRTKIFACQNPTSEGGGRKFLPKSFLNRFTKVFLSTMNRDDYEFILKNIYPQLPEELISTIVEFNYYLQVQTDPRRKSELKFGRIGAPWEFNLRDLLRWCELVIEKKDVFGLNPGNFINLLYITRFRTPEDRQKVRDIWKSVLASKNVAFPIYEPKGYLNYVDDQIFVGSVKIRESSNRSICLSKKWTPQISGILEMIFQCVEKNWMVILTGPEDSGKRSLIKMASELADQKLSRVLLTQNCDSSDLLGTYEQHSKGGEFNWVNSPLLNGIIEGHWVIMENIEYCSPSLLDRLNPLLEPNGSLIISERGLDDYGQFQVVRPHPKFRLFLTVNQHNTMTNMTLSRAMRNRGIEICILSQIHHRSIDKLSILRSPSCSLKRALVLERFESLLRQSSHEDFIRIKFPYLNYIMLHEAIFSNSHQEDSLELWTNFFRINYLDIQTEFEASHYMEKFIFKFSQEDMPKLTNDIPINSLKEIDLKTSVGFENNFDKLTIASELINNSEKRFLSIVLAKMFQSDSRWHNNWKLLAQNSMSFRKINQEILEVFLEQFDLDQYSITDGSVSNLEIFSNLSVLSASANLKISTLATWKEAYPECDFDEIFTKIKEIINTDDLLEVTKAFYKIRFFWKNFLTQPIGDSRTYQDLLAFHMDHLGFVDRKEQNSSKNWEKYRKILSKDFPFISTFQSDAIDLHEILRIVNEKFDQFSNLIRDDQVTEDVQGFPDFSPLCLTPLSAMVIYKLKSTSDLFIKNFIVKNCLFYNFLARKNFSKMIMNKSTQISKSWSSFNSNALNYSDFVNFDDPVKTSIVQSCQSLSSLIMDLLTNSIAKNPLISDFGTCVSLGNYHNYRKKLSILYQQVICRAIPDFETSLDRDASCASIITSTEEILIQVFSKIASQKFDQLSEIVDYLENSLLTTPDDSTMKRFLYLIKIYQNSYQLRDSRRLIILGILLCILSQARTAIDPIKVLLLEKKTSQEELEEIRNNLNEYQSLRVLLHGVTYEKEILNCLDEVNAATQMGTEHPIIGNIIQIYWMLEKELEIIEENLISISKERLESNLDYAKIRKKMSTFMSAFSEDYLLHSDFTSNQTDRFAHAAQEISLEYNKGRIATEFADIIQPFLLGLYLITQGLVMRENELFKQNSTKNTLENLIRQFLCSNYPFDCRYLSEGRYKDNSRRLVEFLNDKKCRELLHNLNVNWIKRQADQKLRKKSFFDKNNEFNLSMVIISLMSKTTPESNKFSQIILNKTLFGVILNWRLLQEERKRLAEKQNSIYIEADRQKNEVLLAINRQMMKKKETKNTNKDLPELLDPDLDMEIEWRLRFPEEGMLSAQRELKLATSNEMDQDDEGFELNQDREALIKQAVKNLQEIDKWVQYESDQAITHGKSILFTDIQLIRFIKRLFKLLEPEEFSSSNHSKVIEILKESYRFGLFIYDQYNEPLRAPYHDDHELYTHAFMIRECLKETESKIQLNVYQDPMPSCDVDKALKMSKSIEEGVNKLLELWPDNPLLKKIKIMNQKVASFSLNESPISKFVAGFEMILYQIQEWEKVASSQYSLIEIHDAMCDCLVDWRKKEMKYWTGALDVAMIQFEDRAYLLWFNLADIFLYNKSKDLTERGRLLMEMMENCQLGEFQTRLKIIKATANACRYWPSLERKDQMTRSRFLFNIYWFYKQFEPSVLVYLTHCKAKINNEMKTFIGLIKWGNYHSFWSMKSSVDKCKKTIHKGIKSWEDILRSSVKKIFDKDYSLGLFEKFAKGLGSENFTTKQNLDVPLLMTFESFLATVPMIPEQFKRYAKVINKIQKFNKTTSESSLSVSVQCLKETHGSWIASILDLQSKTEDLSKNAPDSQLLQGLKENKIDPLKVPKEKIDAAKAWRVQYSALQQNKRLLLKEWLRFLELKGSDSFENNFDKFFIGLDGTRGKRTPLTNVNSRIELLRDIKLEESENLICRNAFMQLLGIRSCIPDLNTLTLEDAENIQEIGGPRVVEKLVSLLDDGIVSVCKKTFESLSYLNGTQDILSELNNSLEYISSCGSINQPLITICKTDQIKLRKTLENLLSNIESCESTLKILQHSLINSESILQVSSEITLEQSTEELLLVPYKMNQNIYSSELPECFNNLDHLSEMLGKLDNLKKTLSTLQIFHDPNTISLGLLSSAVIHDLSTIETIQETFNTFKIIFHGKSYPETFVQSFNQMYEVIISDCAIIREIIDDKNLSNDSANDENYQILGKTFNRLLILIEDLTKFGDSFNNRKEIVETVYELSDQVKFLNSNTKKILKYIRTLLKDSFSHSKSFTWCILSLQPIIKSIISLINAKSCHISHLCHEFTIFTTNYAKIVGQLISKGFCKINGISSDDNWADGKSSNDSHDTNSANDASKDGQDDQMTGLSENISNDQGKDARDVSDQVETRDEFEGLQNDEKEKSDTKDDQQIEDNKDGIEMENDDFAGCMEEGDLEEDDDDQNKSDELDDRMNDPEEDERNNLDRELNRDMWASESEDEDQDESKNDARDQSKSGQDDKHQQKPSDSNSKACGEASDDEEKEEKKSELPEIDQTENDDEQRPLADNDELGNQSGEEEEEKSTKKEQKQPAKPKEKSQMVANGDKQEEDNDEIDLDQLKEDELADAEREKNMAEDQVDDNPQTEDMDLDNLDEIQTNQDLQQQDGEESDCDDENEVSENLPEGLEDTEKEPNENVELESSRKMADPNDNNMEESEETQMNNLLNSGNQFGTEGSAPMDHQETGQDDSEKQDESKNEVSGKNQMQSDSQGQSQSTDQQNHSEMDDSSQADGEQSRKRKQTKSDNKRMLDNDERSDKKNIKKNMVLQEDSEYKINPDKTNQNKDTDLYQHLNQDENQLTSEEMDQLESALDAANEDELNERPEKQENLSKKDDPDNLNAEQDIEKQPEHFEDPLTLPEEEESKMLNNRSKTREKSALPKDLQPNEEDVENPVPTYGAQRSLESSIHTQFEILEKLNAVLEADEMLSLEDLKESLQLEPLAKKCEPASEKNVSEDDRIEWNRCLDRSQSLARSLSENLRLVLEPIKASRMTGDFKTGKRLNMRKIIPYIASNFRKDKIWLRRSKPSKRDYRIIIAIDDSSSMSDNLCRQMTFEALTTVLTAFNILEVGKVGICSFGANVNFIHELEESWSDSKGPQVINRFSFDQKTTSLVNLITNATKKFLEQPSSNGKSCLAYNLLLILSDGIFSEDPASLQVKSAVRMAREANIFPVCMIFDDQKKDHSIFDLKRYAGPGQLLPYMDLFPLPYYFVVRDIVHLPNLIADALRQWFELTTAMSNFKY